MRRRDLLRFGLVLVPGQGRAGVLGDACVPTPAERNGSYAVSFGAAKPSVWFVATRHSGDPASATFKLVRDALDAARPAVAIVEGLQTTLGYNPQQARLVSMTDATFHGGEATYAAMISAQRGIAYIGGEVDTASVDDALLREYSEQAILRAYLVRAVSARVRVKPLADQGALQLFLEDQTERLCREDPRLASAASGAGDVDWFSRRFGIPVVINPNNELIGTPCSPDAEGPLISRATDIRNLHLLKLIQREADNRTPVLVVYGSGHLRALLPPLERAYGAPELRLVR